MITTETIKRIRELSEQGQSIKEIAEQLNISDKTVRKYKNTPAPTTHEAAESTGDLSNTPDYSTDDTSLSSPENPEDEKKQDDLKGRHFCFVVYPSEKWIKEHDPECQYDGADGWGEAPDDWIEVLQNTGLPFVVSPLHDQDENPNNTKKKPHWHVIVSWKNTTTYRNARVIAKNILHSPRPQLLSAVKGMYRYLNHLDNPEKHFYNESPKVYNGWERPLDNSEINAIKAAIRKLIYLHNCQEYGEIVAVCAQIDIAYFDVVSSHTFFFDRLCSSFRHAPVVTLERVLPEYEGEEADEILRLIHRYSGGFKNESSDT